MSTGTPKATEIYVALTSKTRRITHAPTFALRRVQRRRPWKLLLVSAGRRFRLLIYLLTAAVSDRPCDSASNKSGNYNQQYQLTDANIAANQCYDC